MAWWVQLDVAPSLLTSLTGLPSPTTGGTRAMEHLFAGDLLGSLRYNALAIPLTILFLGTLWGQLGRLLLRKRLCMPAWSVRAWIGLLAVAWVFKFLGERSTW